MKHKVPLTVDFVRWALDYDPETGVFERARPPRVGMRVGVMDDKGYIRISLGNRDHYAHRLAWLHFHGRYPANQIDHINGQRDDNRIENLREATTSQNLQNQHRPTRASSTGFLGVRRQLDKWAANIVVDGRTIGLGVYDTPEEASSAYWAGKAKYHTFWADGHNAMAATNGETK